MCQDINIELSTPRTCGRQTQRSNVPAESPSVYYHRSISIPLFHHLLTEMRSRFTSHQETTLLGLCIVPSVLVILSSQEVRAKIAKLS